MFEQWRAWLAACRLAPALLSPAREQTTSIEEELELAYQNLEKAQQTAKHYHHLYEDAQSDMHRFKQRLEQAQTEYTKQGQQALLKELLPLFHDLWRAFQERPADLADHPWVSGVDLVSKQLTASLENMGVLYTYGEVGQPFNPHWHEAVKVVVRPDLQEGTITVVHKQGYVLGKRILSPAAVTVSALTQPVWAQMQG